MNFTDNFYLNKYGFIKPQILEKPKDNLEIIIVIPCFNEENLIQSLSSIQNCKLSEIGVEVIVVINSGVHHSEAIKNKNKETYLTTQNWISNQNEGINFYLIGIDDLPQKHAGVGLARKIGMDEAVFRFHQLKKEGIIVCFDADSLCEANYLVEIKNHFAQFPNSPGCSIYYEHPIEGNDFDENIYKGIIFYELYLRYYALAILYTGLPYAFQTIGSSMAVRSSAYQKQGGMNKRKAGEDFYFIHKIIQLGDFTRLNSAKVIPSPRISDRVPFGTGKAIGDWVEKNNLGYETYAFEIFKIIKNFVEIIPKLYQNKIEDLPFFKEPIHQHLIDFLVKENFEKDVEEIIKNSTHEKSFVKRFMIWFNAFQLLKSVHYLRDVQFPNQELEGEAIKLAKELEFYQNEKSAKDLLLVFRNFERKT